MSKKKIAVLSGDGIGPEVIAEAIKVLRTVEKLSTVKFEFTEALVGAKAIHTTGSPLPEETLAICKSSDAILFGAIGSPEFDNNPNAKIRPEQGLLKLRKELGLFANIRPVKTFKAIQHLSPLKAEIIKHVDFVVFRELTGGIYFGRKEIKDNGKTATDLCEYTEYEILRIAKLAFESARTRKRKVTLIDKANVLETSRLWRKTVKELSKSYPDVELETMYVDNAAMKIIQNPSAFDVMLTENMFGDILTDEASVISGSLGLMPSASIGTGVSLFEPIHGSYPEGAGKGIANPIGAILSAAMMLEYSFGMVNESNLIKKAVKASLNGGVVTKDLNFQNFYFTSEVGDTVASLLQQRVVDLV